MFCSKCGSQLGDGMRYCTSCGQDSQAAVQVIQVRPQSISLNQPLASGNGDYIKVQLIIRTVLQLVFGCIFLAVGAAFSISRNARDIATLFKLLGFFLLLVSPILSITLSLKNIRTNLSVYEDVVKGNGIVVALGIGGMKVLLAGFSSPKDFCIPISEIRHVDVPIRTSITVYTESKKYICFMRNGEEVRDRIWELVNLHGANITKDAFSVSSSFYVPPRNL